MSRLIIFFSFLLVVLSPLGAKKASKDTPPMWVTEPSLVYSSDEYIIDLGEGKSQTEADSKAIEGLAAIFNRSIQSQTNASMEYSEGASGARKDKKLKQDVKISTEVEGLIGVEIKERWKAKDGTYYALAVMEINKGRSIYGEKASSCIKAIDKFFSVTNDQKNTFYEYFRASSAIYKAQELLVYTAYLSVLDPSGRRDWDSYFPDAIKLKTSEIAKNIYVSVNIEGDDASSLQPIFEKVFSKRGFSVSKDGNSRYVLNVVLELEEPEELSRGRVSIHYNLQVELLDTVLDETILPFNLDGRETMFNEKATKNKIFKNLEKKVKNEFDVSFAKYIEEDPKSKKKK